MSKYGPQPKPVETRFWPKVSGVPGPGCWLWMGGKRSGYGAFLLNNPRKQESAHRVAWMLTNGEIPDGLMVLHRCDVKACVRPSHLYLGTKVDNARDASERGQLRGRRRPNQNGERNHQSRLTLEAVSRLRVDWMSGRFTSDELGAKYGVSRTAAWAAATRRTWR